MRWYYKSPRFLVMIATDRSPIKKNHSHLLGHSNHQLPIRVSAIGSFRLMLISEGCFPGTADFKKKVEWHGYNRKQSQWALSSSKEELPSHTTQFCCMIRNTDIPCAHWYQTPSPRGFKPVSKVCFPP